MLYLIDFLSIRFHIIWLLFIFVISRVIFPIFLCSEVVVNIKIAIEVNYTLFQFLNLLFFWLYLLFQRADLFVQLLFNWVYDFVFHFVKARLELAEAFFKYTFHTHKHISDLLRHCRTERLFKLWFHSLDYCFSVPLALITESYYALLEFQNFSDNNLHCIFGLIALTLNNAVFVENLSKCIVHLDHSISYLSLY